jgi:hypothetical protein
MSISYCAAAPAAAATLLLPLFSSLSLTHVYFETINKLKLFFECGIPMPQDAGNTFAFVIAHF